MLFTTPPLPIIDRPADERHLSAIRRVSSIRLIILHATAGSLNSSLDWLTVNPRSNVSVHRLIHTDGTIYKLASDGRVCNHAGYSRWGSTTNLNPISLGIELVNRNDGVDVFEAPQVLSCAAQCAEWIGLYGYLPIVAHATVDTKGKTDPASFPWDLFYHALDARILAAERG